MPVIKGSYYSQLEVDKAKAYAATRGMEKHWEIYLPAGIATYAAPSPAPTVVHHHHHSHRDSSKKYDSGDVVASAALGLLTGGLLF